MTTILITAYILICIVVGTLAVLAWNDESNWNHDKLSLPASIVLGLLAALIGTPILILFLALCLTIALLPEILICATLIFLFA